jgi:TRAP-type transport system periplasmic protein
VFFLPYAFDHIQMARRVMDGPLGKAFADGMSSTQVKLLGFVDPTGFQIITNSSLEIRTPAQLKGLRIRTIPGAKPLEAMLDSVGVIPVKVGSREEISALSNGTIDGQMNTAASIISRGIDTVQQYATLTNHAYVPYVWIYNRAAFDVLSEADQKVIEAAAKKSIALAHQRAIELENSDRGTRGLHRRLQVKTLSATDKAAFKAAMRPAVEKAIIKQIGENGEEWLQRFIKATSN